ncbi:RHS repeat-associated core domain-containing protein [Yersinia enterocolitica]|uniref:RHS repeat-associated core domain-containing protein n=1 Tax=Yersinia enterocolitica TaxID=630 RepID=UPI003D013B62
MTNPFNPIIYSNTPTIAISDNRGLAVRALAYNRTNANDSPDELITCNSYNPLGQLIASRDARLDIDNFRYQHNLGGAVLRTEGVDNGRSVQLADIEGRPVVSLDANGTRTWLTYEPELGRPLEHYQQTKHGLKTITDRFLYGKSSNEHKTANLNGQCIRHYDTAGLQELVSLSITGVALQQQRQLLTDTLGPVDWFGEEQSWRSRLSQPFVTRCTTGALGQPITQTDAKGHSQRMAYNRTGQLIGSWLTLRRGHEQIIVQSLTYSAAGQKLCEESGNGVVTEYRYEAETQRLIGIKTIRPERVQGPKILQDLRYDYDPVGNILAIHNDAEATRFYRNQKVVPENIYRYDALYQLIEATGRETDSNGAQSAHLPALSSLTDGNQYVNYTRRYSYDRAGNLLKIQHTGASQYSTNITVSDSSNHGIQQQDGDGLTAADIRGQFDAAGNQQQLQPGQQLQWNARHQLQQVTTVRRGAENAANDDENYLYASDGMRVMKQSIQHTDNTRQTSTVTYLPGLELRSQHNDNQLTEDFQVITVGAAGRAQVRVLHWEHGKPDEIDNNQLRYSFDNQIGSSLLELDNNGDIISQEEYYPFGGTAIFAARNTTEVKYKTVRYSGKERDATGLYYYGFRYYMPWLGRWLSADPAGTIDGLNLFCMVDNNPVTFHDSDGLRKTGRAARKQVAKAFVHSSHMPVLEQISREHNIAMSVREAGIYTIKALEVGAAAKGHNILEKTIKPGSLKNAYGAQAASVLKLAKSIGVVGMVGAWNNDGIYGIHVHNNIANVDHIVPIDLQNPQNNTDFKKFVKDGLITPYTGDYDMHDIIRFHAHQGAVPKAESAEETGVKDLINHGVAKVDINRPADNTSMNVVRHGPQVSFVPYMWEHEQDKVVKDNGYLGIVARPGPFPIAMVHQGQWGIFDNTEELFSFYKNTNTPLPEHWAQEFQDRGNGNVATPSHAKILDYRNSQ